MNVLFSTYSGAKENPGGGEIQLIKTKESLEKKGIKVEMLNESTKMEEFDLLHNFSLHRECLKNINAVKKAGLKIAVSTIYWPSQESILWQPWKNKPRAIAAGILNSRLFGHFSETRKIIGAADLLLPNSVAEKKMLEKEFTANEGKIQVIPNAVDESFFNADKKEFLEKTGLNEDFILFAGRIEPRKNVLGFIKAANQAGIPAVIIGSPPRNSLDYLEKCKKTANSKIHFMESIPHDSSLLKSAYAAAKVFVLPSWYETPGLAALEAAAAGANIVITEKGCAKEYFGNYASYVNPANSGEIREKILFELMKEKNSALSRHISKNFTWEKAAEKTEKAYAEMLGAKDSKVF